MKRKTSLSSVLHRLVLGWLILLGSLAPATAVDLSPASWPPGEFEKYSALTYDYDRPHPVGSGRRGLIAGTTSALAVRSGLEALKQGGSAADAAIATAMAQIVLTAGCCMSFAGDYMLTYYEADSNRVFYLDGSLATVRGETDPLSIPPRGTPSGRSALVPGFMAGIGATHDRFGRLPWDSLFEPSIYFAEEGFVLDEFLERAFAYREDVLTRLPETRRIFISPDGDLYQAGELFRQPQLANTLERVARRGSKEMYTGRWARRFVRAVRREGGKMKRSDLRRYDPEWGDVVRFAYRDHEIFLPGTPATGGGYIEWMLGQLRPYDLNGMGHYTRSADALYHLMGMIRDFWIGGHYGASMAGQRASEHTDSVVVIDIEGNIAAAQYSIYTSLWGTTGIFVGGVSIGDTAASHQEELATLGPGDLLPNPGNTLIAMKDGRPALAIASIGAGLIEVTAQALVDMIDYGLGVKPAESTPTVRQPAFSLPDRPARVTRGEFDTGLLDTVRAMGIPIVEELPGEESGKGYWSGVTISPNGRLLGATSNEFNGWAEGY
jgi:gamma-glutamyltranspeptidase/glutathione hydrolase